MNNFSIECYRKQSALPILTYHGPFLLRGCSWSPNVSPPYCHSLRTFSFSEHLLLNIPDTKSNPKIPINFCEIIMFFLNQPVMPKGFYIYQTEVSITGHQDLDFSRSFSHNNILAASLLYDVEAHQLFCLLCSCLSFFSYVVIFLSCFLSIFLKNNQ